MTFSWRPSGVISLINTTFQFKLFANNATKLRAPGNRTPPLSDIKIYMIFDESIKDEKK